MKLLNLANLFLLCNVNNGRSALFWHDNWTGLGPLLHISGANGPRVTGSGASSMVSHAVFSGRCALSRGRHPILVLFRECLPTEPPNANSLQNDMFVWRNSPTVTPLDFSSSRTWESLQVHLQRVWHSFHSTFQKHSFIVWVTARDRLPTRDKLLARGLNVSPSCPLWFTLWGSRPVIFQVLLFLEVWNYEFNIS